MENKKEIEVRDLRDGHWYWIHKSIIQEYAPQIGAMGLATYNFLASLADSGQSCFPSQKYMAGRLGYSRATINKSIKILEKAGLIHIRRKDRYHWVYCLLKVKSQASRTQGSNKGNPDVKWAGTNDTDLKKTKIKKIDRDNTNSMKWAFDREFKPETREELLALDLAQGLDDLKGIRLYLSYARKYPESFLRQIMAEICQIPSGKIKKSRGALFNHLVQRDDSQKFKDPGN